MGAAGSDRHLPYTIGGQGARSALWEMCGRVGILSVLYSQPIFLKLPLPAIWEPDIKTFPLVPTSMALNTGYERMPNALKYSENHACKKPLYAIQVFS